MEFLTALSTGLGASAAASLTALHLMGKDNRAKIVADIKAATHLTAAKVATATEVAKENRENGKGTSVVENPDGTLSKVDRSTEVVEFRKQMNTFEEVNRKADNNPNRPYPPEWGTPDWRQWPDE